MKAAPLRRFDFPTLAGVSALLTDSLFGDPPLVFESFLFPPPAVNSLCDCQHHRLWDSHPLIPPQQRGHWVLRLMSGMQNSSRSARRVIFVSLIFFILNSVCNTDLCVFTFHVVRATMTNTDFFCFTGVWTSTLQLLLSLEVSHVMLSTFGITWTIMCPKPRMIILAGILGESAEDKTQWGRLFGAAVGLMVVLLINTDLKCNCKLLFAWLATTKKAVLCTD